MFAINTPCYVLALIIALIAHQSASEVCTNDECHQAAERVKNSIDRSVDPCDDFYTYACGNWMKMNPLQPSDSRRNQFKVVAENLTAKVLDIVTHEGTGNDPQPLAKAKTFYRACVDTSTMDARGLEPVRKIIRAYGGWPLIDDKPCTRTIQNLFVVLTRHFLLPAVISVYADLDMKNTNQRMIMVDQPTFFIARDFLVDPESFQDRINAYRELVIGVVKQFWPDIDSQILLDRVNDMLKFEMELASAATSDEDRRNVTSLYNPFTVEQFQKFYDTEPAQTKKAEINFLELLRHTWPDTDITQEEQINVIQPGYFPAMKKILDKTSEETIINYIQWRWVALLLEATTNNMRDLLFSFDKVMKGVKEPQNRTKTCADYDLSSTYYSLGYAVSEEYIQRYFPPSDKTVVDEMVSNVRAAFAFLVESDDWMDPKTKATAREKLAKISLNLAYPDWLLNATAIKEYYEGFVVYDETHLENRANLFTWESLKSLNKLRKPVNKSEGDFHALFINAFYDPQRNSINFPAAILVPPFFEAKQIAALNFGGICTVIGHEITHGFDDQGSEYDVDGNLNNWWEAATRRNFEQRAQCLIDQYGNFSTPKGNVNGRLTAGENIADNGGIREAIRGYQKWVQDKGIQDERLPGLEEFTADQLFFLGFAQVWCGNISPQMAELLLKVDVHSPGMFRVIGTLQNTERFSQAFNCSAGSRMNPPNKCVLW